jgi:Flp pilus assembly protein TadD
MKTALLLITLFPMTHNNLGVIYVQKNDLDSARATLERLKDLNASLAGELAWVIEHGREKEPEHFFGVVRSL